MSHEHSKKPDTVFHPVNDMLADQLLTEYIELVTKTAGNLPGNTNEVAGFHIKIGNGARLINATDILNRIDSLKVEILRRMRV
jgi:hypothetical protein